QVNIGNATGNGSSNVRIGSVVQEQHGQFSNQQINIGNTSGHGRADVNVGWVVQSQDDSFRSRQLSIGNTSNGSSTISIGGVMQYGNNTIIIGD
ncbi:MAG: hypothetical protein LBB76_03175, partial [Azoarcus sp.]|nr:hypothetical protein [Azoarcus sp.]